MELVLSGTETWEEEMYWKHFHAMHFYQVLSKDFLDRLVFPSKFAEHISTNLPNKVSLIGPSGAAWDVEVLRTGSLALGGEGWKDFVKAYNLEENLLVVFKYKQNSSFEVLIFDQKNFCEKESSYFVKKSSPKPDHRIIKKRNECETASTEMMENNDDVNGGSESLSKKHKNRSSSSEKNHDDADLDLSDKAIDDVIVKVISSGGMKSCALKTVAARNGGRSSGATRSKAQSARKLIVDNVAKKLRQLNEEQQMPTENGGRELIEKVITNAGNGGNSGALSAQDINGDSPAGTNHSGKLGGKKGRAVMTVNRGTPISAKKSVSKSGPRLSKEYMSNRRPVTSEEKEAAITRANEALTEGSFIVVLRPTAVYRKFYVSIPSDWMNKNLPQCHQEIILRIGEKTWVTMFHWYSQRASSGGLGTGWKNFAVENNLEESDVCLFKPANLKEDATLILDVEIFRVVKEFTPLSPAILPLSSIPYDSPEVTMKPHEVSDGSNI